MEGFRGTVLYDGGRTWGSLCRLAGVTPKTNEPVRDEVYFGRLTAAIKQLGRIPKSSERKRFGLNFTKRRYPTLQAFVDRAIELGHLPAPSAPTASAPQKTPPAISPTSAVTSASKAVRPVPPIPLDTRRSKWERTGIDGFPYAPQDELGVVALFGILCSQGRNRLADSGIARRQRDRHHVFRPCDGPGDSGGVEAHTFSWELESQDRGDRLRGLLAQPLGGLSEAGCCAQ